MNEKGLKRYYFRTFLKPKSTFELLLTDENFYKYGFIYILLPIAGYTLMYVLLTIGKGAPSVFTPWLNIPKETYYSVNRFLLAPSMIMGWLLASSFMHIVSRFLNGKGSFEQTMSILALCISAAMLPALMHDLPMSFFSATGVINAAEHEVAMNQPTIWRTLLWSFYSLYFFYFLFLFPKAVSAVHKLSKPNSIFIGLFSFVLFQTVFFLFNR